MLVLLIVLGKFMIGAAVVRLFRSGPRSWRRPDAIGEFSYVLVHVARNASLLDPSVDSATLAASLLTILLNAFPMRMAPQWLQASARGIFGW